MKNYGGKKRDAVLIYLVFNFQAVVPRRCLEKALSAAGG